MMKLPIFSRANVHSWIQVKEVCAKGRAPSAIAQRVEKSLSWRAGGGVRIVGGSLGGREIARKVPSGVRPTTDRVREAIFSLLEARGAVRGAHVLDLFGGTGAMGLEALSRGAVRVDYVERSAKVAQSASREAARLGVSGAFVVWVDSVEQLLLRGQLCTADLIFADPPYGYDGFASLGSLMPSASWAVIESDRAVDLGERWAAARVHNYGRTVVAVYRPCEQEELSQ